MLLTPKDESSKEHKRNKSRQKHESTEDEEEVAARLLTEDPMDWVLKNEHVLKMLSVRLWKP